LFSPIFEKQKCSSKKCRRTPASFWKVLDLPQYIVTDLELLSASAVLELTRLNLSKSATLPGEHNTSSALQGDSPAQLVGRSNPSGQNW
jgi:hypothetical protein